MQKRIVVIMHLVYSAFGMHHLKNECKPGVQIDPYPGTRIPAQIIITHKYETMEEIVKTKPIMAGHINNIMQMNPGMCLRYVGHSACRHAIRRTNEPEMLAYFNELPHGAVKADVCRVAVLFLEGGFYIDSDFDPVAPLHTFVHKNSTLVTAVAVGTTKANMVILFALRGDAIIKQTIKKQVEWYTTPSVRDWHMGPETLTRAIVDLCGAEPGNMKQLPQECGSSSLELYTEKKLPCDTDVDFFPMSTFCPPSRSQLHEMAYFALFKYQNQRPFWPFMGYSRAEAKLRGGFE